jgi:hypothetical protein
MQTLSSKYTLLGYEATQGQLEIVGAVLDPQVKRLLISAMTRYGKTLFVAIGLLLLIANTPVGALKKPKRITMIAPTNDQTKILRGYVANCIAKNKTLSALLDESTRRDPSRLKTEISKQRLTFKNNWEFITLTAHAGENETDPAPNLMGWGGDIVVIDEADLIRKDVYTSRISRMLGDDAENAKLITIVNPWDITNFAHEQSLDPTFRQINIDFRQALQEGRTTQTYLNEQKALLSDYEWTVLYESKWSAESEDTLIRYDWIQRAVNRTKNNNIQFTSTVTRSHGADIAEQGKDKTILTHTDTDGRHYKVYPQEWIRDDDTTDQCADNIAAKINKNECINIDSNGVGAGVYSRLLALGYKVTGIRGAESPTVDADRYLNLKAQRYWQLRTIFEQDLISIPNDPLLISQLSQMRYKFSASGKIQIIDPEGKSPDYADSLMLTVGQTASLNAPPPAWSFG